MRESIAGLRVGLDVHMIGERETGNETYAVNLLRALLAREDGSTYLPLTPYPERLAPVDPRAPGRALRVRPASAALRIGLGIPWAARRHRLDLVHMTYLAPPRRLVPAVVTVHDLSFEAMPETFSRRDRQLLGWGVPWAVRQAVRIITDADYTKRDLVTRYRVPAERVHVVPLAAGPAFRRVEEPGRRATVLERHGIRPPFILSVGNLQPRKNLARLLEAFRLLTAGGAAIRLVVVGQKGWGPTRLEERVDALGLAGQVIVTGYVPEAELPALYSAAACFAYPALYEGFGLPPLEAMACGSPVVASDSACLPEILGDGALLVDARDPGALAEALQAVLASPARAAELSLRGMARAATYSWERAAAETVAVYREAAAEIRGRREGRR